MGLVLLCVAIMGGLGILFAIGLAVVSRFFHVETDPRIQRIAEALPGANCGACGLAGCDAYAEAIVKGHKLDLCIVGGQAAAEAVAEIMGMALEGGRQEMRAVVRCQGGTDRCGQRYYYEGIQDCRAADLLQAGPKMCEYGCLGLGTCVAACPFDAIAMGPDQTPVIDWDKCTGCGSCVNVCPRNIIELLPITIPCYVACSSQDKGKVVKQTCKVGCIACMLCRKFSPDGAVEKDGNLPRLTYPEGVDYAKAIEKCPMHCFVKIERAPAPSQAAVASGVSSSE